MWRILTILLVLAGSIRAETVQGLAKPAGYVSDYANVLSSSDKTLLEQQCTTVHRQTGTQIAVVTIHRLEGATAQEFAQSLFDSWKIGSKGTDQGVLMLFSIEDHKRWINVGYGLEGALNDAKVGDIGRSMVPFLRVGKYGIAMQLGVSGVADAILAARPDASDRQPATASVAASGAAPVKSGTPERWVGPAVLIWIFVMVAIVIVLGRRRGWVSSGSSPLFAGSQNDSSSSDSVSSFSSSDSSSESSSSPSDSSSGSDFGGFDGGSSGGGGAGGDW